MAGRYMEMMEILEGLWKPCECEVVDPMIWEGTRLWYCKTHNFGFRVSAGRTEVGSCPVVKIGGLTPLADGGIIIPSRSEAYNMGFWNWARKSRKFWLALFGVVQTLVFHFIPGFPAEVWASIDALVMVLIAGIAFEDAAAKRNGG